MTAKLEKTLKRELSILGELYVISLAALLTCALAALARLAR